jgi:hypothetical protein
MSTPDLTSIVQHLYSSELEFIINVSICCNWNYYPLYTLPCDVLITHPEESYRVSNCVWLRHLKGGGQGPILSVEPLDGWIHIASTKNKNHVQRPTAKLQRFQKSAYYAGTNIFDSLSSSLTSLRNKTGQFK